MELSFARQSTAFLYSIPLGAVLGIIYGALALLRHGFKMKKGAVVALDILYMLCCSFCVFFFSLGFLDGYIRIYVIFGCLIGFFIYRLTIGRILKRILEPIFLITIKIIAAILTKIKIIAKKLLKIGCGILYNVYGRLVLFMSANICNKDRRNKYVKIRKKKGKR